MSDLQVVATRGSLPETTHQVSAAVVAADGRIVAYAGNPEMVTFWRSCAKPFQLLPLVEDGGIERFGLDTAMLALACASHNAEPIHREVGARWLAAIGATEDALACGGHPSIWPALANRMIHDEIVATPLWSNCSGNHAAMLAFARLHGWPDQGYESHGHPANHRIGETIARWSGIPADRLVWGVDGCTAAAVALPLRAMARAYAALGTTTDGSLGTIRGAMSTEPYLLAGAGRLDTVLMQAWPGRVIAKIGADGVYTAALPTLGLGIALKVHNGDMMAACVALVGILEAVAGQFGRHEEWPLAALMPWRSPAILNTRGGVTGYINVDGGVRWA